MDPKQNIKSNQKLQKSPTKLKNKKLNRSRSKSLKRSIDVKNKVQENYKK